MKTILSAGEILYELLTTDEAVNGIVTKVFPVVTDNAELPYIAYRRQGFRQTEHKSGRLGADTATYAVRCYAKTYSESITLAEAVRSCLDGVQAKTDDVCMRSCYLVDSSEAWENDAYVQELIFDIKI